MELNELRKIAEAATPGPWTLEYENSDDWEAGINDGDYPYTIHGPRNCSFDNWADKSMVQDSLNRVTEISEMVDADAEFIATFDPPTALTLLSRLEQAEQAVDNDRLADELLTDRDYWEAKLTSLVYSLATEEEVGEWSSMNDIADNLIDHIGGKVQRLEQERDKFRAAYSLQAQELEQAEQAIQRVRAKHAERVLVYPNGADEHYCSAEENSAWPCDTIRALDGEQS